MLNDSKQVSHSYEQKRVQIECFHWWNNLSQRNVCPVISWHVFANQYFCWITNLLLTFIKVNDIFEMLKTRESIFMFYHQIWFKVINSKIFLFLFKKITFFFFPSFFQFLKFFIYWSSKMGSKKTGSKMGSKMGSKSESKLKCKCLTKK